MLKLQDVQVFSRTSRRLLWRAAVDAFKFLLKKLLVLPLSRLNLNLLLCQLFPQPGYLLRLIFKSELLTVNLDWEFINVSLKMSLFQVLSFQLLLNLLDLVLQITGLSVQAFDLLSELFFVTACDVKFFNRRLDVLQSSSLLFLKQPSFLLVLSLEPSAETLNLILIHLVHLELNQLEFSLFLLSRELELLLLSLGFCFKLLSKRFFIVS